VTRLKGAASTESPTAPKSVNTVVGPRELNSVVAAFTRIHWPKGRDYRYGEFESTFQFGGSEIQGNLALGHKGPLFAIGYDEAQFYAVVRVDDTSPDPIVYLVDHDGSSRLEGGVLLSLFLAKIKARSGTNAKAIATDE
jgi:hypothetical protein